MKFQTVEELQEKIEAYFQSCFQQRYIHRKKKGVKNAEYPDDYEWVAELDHNGEVVYEQIAPFTVTGLANYLGTTRDLLLDYEEKDEFSDTIKAAKGKIEQYVEEYLFNGKNTTGAIFNLKNNYGWKDKTETDVTSGGQQIGSIDSVIAAMEAARTKGKSE